MQHEIHLNSLCLNTEDIAILSRVPQKWPIHYFGGAVHPYWPQVWSCKLKYFLGSRADILQCFFRNCRLYTFRCRCPQCLWVPCRSCLAFTSYSRRVWVSQKWSARSTQMYYRYCVIWYGVRHLCLGILATSNRKRLQGRERKCSWAQTTSNPWWSGHSS